MLPYNKSLRERSRQLRENMTYAERHLWSKIRRKQLRGYIFYRQKPVGEYIVDFYCPKAKLVVEIDGGQHFSDETTECDHIRNQYMASLSLKVLRFTNAEVKKNTKRVIERIVENL